LPDEFEFESDIDLKYFARNYVLSPSSIINVLKNCSLLCQKRDERVIRLMDIQAGLKREMNNEDNLLS